IYQDQIYLPDAGHFYPADLTEEHKFDGLEVLFRAIRPSDEDQMRRLFYRFSDRAVYYRYFSPIKAMPHPKMQEYVNVDYKKVMSIVGLVRESGMETIIAEARYVRHKDSQLADVAFIVDEEYQGRGIASYMFNLLIRAGMDRGIEGFTADVLTDNKSMMKVFENSPYPIQTKLEDGSYSLLIPFRGKAD
ncbi:MAG: GNAT family N-acetyltransferase, partial [Syntrophaceae bacterium]